MEPKVSILIPTYNRPEFFEQALKSALDQTYKNIEIVICDNSDNGLTEKIVERYNKSSTSEINYVRNTQNIGPIANQQKCFDLSTGEYVNYLMDDDLFHPQKIEKMIHYFLRDAGITLVTSNRKRINAYGELMNIFHFFKKDTIIDGIELGNSMLRTRINCIGEPTTVLFRKRDLGEPFGVFEGRQAQYCVDVASWLNLLAKGKAACIEQPLSSFRYHPLQLSHSRLGPKKNREDWANFIKDAPQKGYLRKFKY